MPVELDPDKPVLAIGVAAEIVGLTQATLRVYEREGLVSLSRNGSAKRLYSLNDLARLRFLFYLTRVRKIGIPGCRYILELLDQVCEEDRARMLADSDAAPHNLSAEARVALQQEMPAESPNAQSPSGESAERTSPLSVKPSRRRRPASQRAAG